MTPDDQPQSPPSVAQQFPEPTPSAEAWQLWLSKTDGTCGEWWREDAGRTQYNAIPTFESRELAEIVIKEETDEWGDGWILTPVLIGTRPPTAGELAERDRVKAELEQEQVTRERDALLNTLVETGPETPPLWWALLPDSFSPLGRSWNEYADRDSAIHALFVALGVRQPITQLTGAPH